MGRGTLGGIRFCSNAAGPSIGALVCSLGAHRRGGSGERVLGIERKILLNATITY